VAYDSIGRTTVPSSLDSLSRRGLLAKLGYPPNRRPGQVGFLHHA
jgi:hypothetical protein